jgi:MFS family permease
LGVCWILQMERSLRFNIAAGFFGMFWICAPLGAPLPLLMQALEATSTQLGMLSAAWQVAMLAQIPAAFLAEGIGRRKTMWAVVTIAHRLLWAAPAVLPWVFPEAKAQMAGYLIVALGLSNLLANLGTASWTSWMADLVPEDSAGRFWAVRQRVLSAGLIVATALYGWVLDRPEWQTSLTGFQWVFASCSLCGVADVLVHCLVDEPARKTPPIWGNVVERLAAPFRVRGFFTLTLLMALWTGAQSLLGYTLAMPGFFSMVHLRESFGATYSQASLIFVAAALGAGLFTSVLGPWMDRAGAAAVLRRLLVWAPISMMAWWLASPGEWILSGHVWPVAVVWMSFAALAQGAFLTGAFLCQFRLTQMCTREDGRTVAMAVHWSIAGVGGAAGAVFAGWLKGILKGGSGLSWPGHGYAFDVLVLLHVAIAWLVVLPLSARLSREIGPR